MEEGRVEGGGEKIKGKKKCIFTKRVAFRVDGNAELRSESTTTTTAPSTPHPPPPPPPPPDIQPPVPHSPLPLFLNVNLIIKYARDAT